MRARYGASPLHLLAHAGALALAGWALAQALSLGNADRVLLWLAGAVVVHDFLLWPAYTALDRLVRRRGWANHARLAAGVPALLALAFFPVIWGKGERNYARVSGERWDGYAARWLAVSAAVLLAAGLLYRLRSRQGSSR